MSMEPIRQLTVWRTFSDGLKVEVGGLAQNRQGVFFQYNEAYLQQYPALSPFTLKADSSVQLAPAQPHAGLHGVFADSLPDGWGLLLMDRVFRQHGMLPAQVTAMDRLAFVGNSGTNTCVLRWMPDACWQTLAALDGRRETQKQPAVGGHRGHRPLVQRA